MSDHVLCYVPADFYCRQHMTKPKYGVGGICVTSSPLMDFVVCPRVCKYSQPLATYGCKGCQLAKAIWPTL